MEQVVIPGAGKSDESIAQRGTPCVTCEYDLVGLSASGICPECGAPVAVTLSVGLTRQSEQVLSRAISGAILLLIFLGLSVLMLIALSFLGQTMWTALLAENEPTALRTAAAAAAIGIIYACFPFVAIRRFTAAMSPAGRGRFDAPRWRTAARVASVALIALTLIQIPVDYAQTRHIAQSMNSDSPIAFDQDPGYTLIYYLQLVLAMLALCAYTTMIVGVAAHARTILARGGRTRPELRASLVGRSALVIAAIAAVMNVLAGYMFQFTTSSLVTVMMTVYAVMGIASTIVGIAWIVMIAQTLATLVRAKRLVLRREPA